MTKKEFQNKYSPKYDEITINGVTISYDCYEIKVKDGKDVVCFYNEGGYCFMCSIPLEDVDLINRQQAEIEKLNVELVGMRGACNSYKMHYDNAKAEIERLKEEVALKSLKCNLLEQEKAKNISGFVDDLKLVRADAIKEYMKILEEKLSQNTDISNVGYQSIIFDMEQGYKEMDGERKCDNG